jgi:putative membrane protein
MVREDEDATRRTRLANERTYLAWWRTAMTAFAVALGAGKLLPEVSGGAQWPWQAIGVAFAVVGVALVAYGFVRQRSVEDALRRGDYAPFVTGAAFALAAAGVLLGLATIVLVIVEG